MVTESGVVKPEFERATEKKIIENINSKHFALVIFK